MSARIASKKDLIPSEHAEQVEVVRWFDALGAGRIYAIPNGGTRSRAYSTHLHEEGMKTGAPDLVVALPGGRVVWIEMKRRVKSASRISPAQRKEHERLCALDHVVYVCYGADAAIKVLQAELSASIRAVCRAAVEGQPGTED